MQRIVKKHSAFGIAAWGQVLVLGLDLGVKSLTLALNVKWSLTTLSMPSSGVNDGVSVWEFEIIFDVWIVIEGHDDRQLAAECPPSTGRTTAHRLASEGRDRHASSKGSGRHASSKGCDRRASSVCV